MKKCAIALLSLLLAFSFVSCSSTVTRVETGTARELSGNWNERDVEIACSSLLDEMFASSRYQDYARRIAGRPMIRVGSFTNQSDEHIDTAIITTKMQNAIFNSNMADFVSDRSFLDDLHLEQDYGLDYSAVGEAADIGNESAPDLLLQGSVRTIVQRNGRQEVRTYYVYAQLVDVETGVLVWTGENSEISKVVEAQAVRF